MAQTCYAAVLAIVVLPAVSPCRAQPAPRQLTARELFYAASDQAVPPKPANVKPAARPVRTAETRPPRRPVRRPVEAPVAAPAEDGPAVTPPATAPPGRMVSDPGPNLVPATYAPAPRQGVPLGLRYTILKLIDGRMTEVASDTVFHAGDRIQVSVEANDGGYLYIVHQGTSGTWKPLFPSPEIEDGNNRVEKARTYVMPPKSRFYFDGQPGEEKLFIILARKPEADLEKLIYSLRGERPTPVAEPAERKNAPLLMASNLQIEDKVVGRLRTVYARDLVIEKVDDDAGAASAAPQGRREKAVYVVNPTGSPDSRVVADIRLTHR